VGWRGACGLRIPARLSAGRACRAGDAGTPLPRPRDPRGVRAPSERRMTRAAGGGGAGSLEPTAPGQAAVERVIARVAGALTTSALYPPAHPAVTVALAQLQEGVIAACDERRQDSLTFLRLDDEIVVDGWPLRSGALYIQPSIHALRRSDIARLTLARGLALDDCRALVDALATGRRPDSTPHVVVGQVEIAEPAGAPAEPPEAPHEDGGDRG